MQQHTKNPPGVASKPMGAARREAAYLQQNCGRPLTGRQMRQIERMRVKNGEARRGDSQP